MTDKQSTVVVSRETLTRWRKLLLTAEFENVPGEIQDLLAAPVEPQGEPVACFQYDEVDAQRAFEALNPMPNYVTKFKGGYAATEFNAWSAHDFCKKWAGFNRCAKLYRHA